MLEQTVHLQLTNGEMDRERHFVHSQRPDAQVVDVLYSRQVEKRVLNFFKVDSTWLTCQAQSHILVKRTDLKKNFEKEKKNTRCSFQWYVLAVLPKNVYKSCNHWNLLRTRGIRVCSFYLSKDYIFFHNLLVLKASLNSLTLKCR